MDEAEAHLGGPRSENGAPDQLGDLRYYGVSELLIAVYPSGYPMTCSAVSGTGYRWPSTRLHQSCQLFRSGLRTPRLGDCLPPLNAVALGVGHNPHSVPKLSGTSVGSWYAVPFSIIPERGQVSENGSKSPSKESCDVFHSDDFGSKLANKAGEVRPEPASCACKTLATACETDILAGKSSNDRSRSNAVCSQSVCGKCSNIIINGDTREAFAQSGLRLLVELTQGDRLEPARTLKAQIKAADACEQGEYAQLLAHSSRTQWPRPSAARTSHPAKWQYSGLSHCASQGIRASANTRAVSPVSTEAVATLWDKGSVGER